MTSTETTTETCPTCGSPVRLLSGDEGTQAYAPVYLLFLGTFDADAPIGAQNYWEMHQSRDEAMSGASAEFAHDPALDWAQIATLTPEELVIEGFCTRGGVWQWR